MIWPFNKWRIVRSGSTTSAAPKNIPINEDWRVGDLAECVEEIGGNLDRIEVGDVFSVKAIAHGKLKYGHDYGWGLKVVGDEYYWASHFRKVPTITAEEETSFAAQIKRLKPARTDA